MFRRSGVGVEFLSDWQVGDALLRIVAQARERLALVSPYNRHWGHLKREVASARQRGVAVTIYYRADEPDPLGQLDRVTGDRVTADRVTMDGAAVNGVAVRGAAADSITAVPVRMLHAKIYANESVALITTMNLVETSAMYSREVGLLIGDAKLRRQVDDYIKSLHDDAVAEAPQPDAPIPEGRMAYRNGAGRVPTGAIAEAPAKPPGFCIECGDAKGFEPERPLCAPCYGRFGRNGAHRVCHRCGEPHPAQLNEPLCQACREARAQPA